MQVYRDMDILSAMPDAAEMRGVRHHMLGVLSPREKCSAAAYREGALRAIGEIRSRGCLPILCGGTGLYINAVTRPMSFSMQSDEAMHAELMAMGETEEGRQELFRQLGEVDPEAAARLHPNDVRRVSRAIEIYRLTGVTQTEHTRRDRARQGDYREIIFAPDWPREVLYRRIDARVDEMLAHGLVDEVRRLMADPHSHPTAMQAIGYKEIAQALRGEASMEDAIRWTKTASRNLAKRQLTWFRHDDRVIWLRAEGETPESLAGRMREIIEGRA